MKSSSTFRLSDVPKPLLVILLLGIVLRFVFQFVLPGFNVDEVSLGNNIISRDAAGLLYPLDQMQSSPPLFLLIQKLITALPIPVWICLKVISFLASVSSLYLLSRLLNRFDVLAAIVALAIFAFNPFIVYNSLTLKQYTIDLLGVLVLINFYRNENFQKYLPLYFLLWSLMSNVGLFGCAGYLLFKFTEERNITRPGSWLPFLKKHLLIVIAPVPYIAYFAWFMQQQGADELKVYMQQYWQNSFVPLNGDIFKYMAYLIHSVWIYIFNAFEIVGFLLLAICGYGLLKIITKKPLAYKSEIGLVFAVIAINLALNIVKLYPFSDRLYLYTVPFYLLLFAASLHELLKILPAKKIISATLVLMLLGTYGTYMFNKDNDLVMLYAKLEKLRPNDNRTFYGTDRTIEAHDSFNRLTKSHFQRQNPVIWLKADDKLDSADIFVSRVFSKFGPFNKTSAEEAVVDSLIKENKIRLVEQSDGFNIYTVIR